MVRLCQNALKERGALEGAPRLASLLAGEQEAEGPGGGWSWVLSGLKTLLETGKPLAG